MSKWAQQAYQNIITLPNKVLTLEEIRLVLSNLRDQQAQMATSPRRRFWPELVAGETWKDRVTRVPTSSSMTAWHRLITFRLSCCCGLRSKEMCGLRLKDLDLHARRPHLRVRGETSKASAWGPGRSRAVPLWWDQSTLDDLRDYEAFLGTVRGPDDDPDNPFVLYSPRSPNKQLKRPTMRDRWNQAVKILPQGRRLSIHCGRHSFCSHALASGRSLVEVQAAAGHSSILTTQIYLHALDSGTDLPDVFPEEEIDW